MNLIESTTGGCIRYDELTLSPQDGNYRCGICLEAGILDLQISGLEMLQNNGPDAVIDLLAGKWKTPSPR